jgi:hypothetical protein
MNGLKNKIPTQAKRCVVGQFDKEASQTRDYCVRKQGDASRGSPRSFTAQRTLVQDDRQTDPLPRAGLNGAPRG